MNWGKGIAITLGMFMVFIIILTAIKISKVNDLEHENYYDREIAYESEIQAQRNAKSLGLIEISDEDEEFLILRLPEGVEIKRVEIILLRLSDKSLDREYVFENTQTILIPKKELVNGLYKLDVLYQIDNESCLIRRDVMI
ncbi:MAG TPA: FixH family protein [Brumimicrobium sp.]|nr:FixH family protein [Brumimicrobium sp.]